MNSNANTAQKSNRPFQNWTEFPNTLLDKTADLPEAALRIMLVVVRKTYGYHKQRDTISLSQFERLTGLSRQGVLNGIRHLNGLSLLVIDKRRNGSAYEINNDAVDRKIPVHLVDFDSKKPVHHVD